MITIAISFYYVNFSLIFHFSRKAARSNDKVARYYFIFEDKVMITKSPGSTGTLFLSHFFLLLKVSRCSRTQSLQKLSASFREYLHCFLRSMHFLVEFTWWFRTTRCSDQEMMRIIRIVRNISQRSGVNNILRPTRTYSFDDCSFKVIFITVKQILSYYSPICGFAGQMNFHSIFTKTITFFVDFLQWFFQLLSAVVMFEPLSPNLCFRCNQRYFFL